MTLPIPDAALDDRLGFVGTAGSGKSYTAMGRVERLLAKRARVCCIDPLGVFWGLRLLPDGKTESGFNIPIFGGPHGDLPLTEHSGALIGETVAGMAESCIVDLSEIGTKNGERRFMLHFLTALYRKSKDEPLHLVIDEADMFAPQKLTDKEGEAAKLLGMMETVIRRGRIKGFIPWLITQRPAVIAKDVLSQVDGLVAFKLTSSQDRDALSAWVEGSADKEDWKVMRAALPAMERGQGLVWIPGRGIMNTVHFPEKHTFDSSRTPKRGEKKSTTILTPLDLGSLKERLAKVDAETKANDPRSLKVEIARLTAEKAALGKQMQAAGKVVDDPEKIAKAEQRGFDRGFDEALARGVRAMGDLWSHILKPISAAKSAFERIEQIHEQLFDLVEGRSEGAPGLQGIPHESWTNITGKWPDIRKRLGRRGDDIHLPSGSLAVRPAGTSPDKRVAPVLRRASSPAASGDGTLPKGERLCLAAMAQYEDGITRQHITVITGYKRSTRDAYIQRLREKDFCNDNGGRLHPTDTGLQALGEFELLPTGEALQQHVLATLPEGERAVLATIIPVYPDGMERDAISVATGYKRSTRDAYIQRLNTRELVDVSGGVVRAVEDLFA